MKSRLLQAALLFLVSCAPAQAGQKDLKTFDAVWSAVQHSFYDPDLHGVDWSEARRIYRPLVASARSDAEVRGLLLDMLALLDSSHTTIVDAPVYRSTMSELLNRRRLTFGVLVEESMPGHYFIRSLYEGGPCDVAGLRVGDRVVAVDGRPIEGHPLLVDAGYDPALPGPPLFFLDASGGRPVRLRVQSRPDAETRRTVAVQPVRMTAVDAAQNSVRVVEKDGVKIGVMHLWFCSRGVVEALEKAVTGPLAHCEALVLDVRGRGGYAQVVNGILDVFRERQTFLGRLRKKPARPPLWSRPLVVLIDHRSRSAKEILAYQVRAGGLGTLVGQQTEGAVLGAVFHALPDGTFLELAGVAVPVDGKSLERVGVPPDYEVDFVVPYAGGEDPILVKGFQIAVREVEEQYAARALGRPF